MNPIQIRQFLLANAARVKSVGDFVCCLPDVYRKNYFVAHSSIAAQDGSVHSPRIILEDPDRGNPLGCVLSFNGGGKGLLQTENVEMICDNQNEKRLETFDIDFSEGKFNGVRKSPDLCVSCHSNNGELDDGGVKPLFTHPPWGRFVDSGLSDNTPGCTQAERRLSISAEKAAQKALDTNLRYQCLEKKPKIVDSFAKILTFEEKLRFLNDRRVSRIAMNTKDYDKFKFAIIGSQLCPNHFDIRDWIPQNILNDMTDMTSVGKELKSSKTPYGTFTQLLDAKMVDHVELQNILKKEADEIERGRGFRTTFDDSVRACLKNDSIIQTGGVSIGEIKAQGRQALTGHLEIDKYILDTKLKSFRGKNHIDPNLRFLFESRGIDVSGWSMNPTPTYHDEFENMVGWLIVNESETSALKEKIFPEFKGNKSLKFTPGHKISGTPQQCSDLQALSRLAWGKPESTSEDLKSKSSKGIR